MFESLISFKHILFCRSRNLTYIWKLSQVPTGEWWRVHFCMTLNFFIHVSIRCDSIDTSIFFLIHRTVLNIGTLTEQRPPTGSLPQTDFTPPAPRDLLSAITYVLADISEASFARIAVFQYTNKHSKLQAAMCSIMAWTMNESNI